MAGWYSKVTADPDDLTPLVDCCEYFEARYEELRKELKPSGRIETIQMRLPGLHDYAYGMLQELEAIIIYLEARLDQVRARVHRDYMEKYNRALTSRDAEKYTDGHDDVFQWAMLKNQVSLVRNKYLGLTKGLSSLDYALSNVVKLRAGGIEDASLG